MTMKLLSKNKKYFIVIICLLLILSLNFFQKEAKGFFYAISSPLQEKLWENGSNTSNFLEAIFKADKLLKENEALKLRVQELLYDHNYMNVLGDENKMLREALNLGFREQIKLELAKIIGKDINRGGILLNKGSENGISKGSFVVNYQKVLVGTIAEVYKTNSKVLLISDKQSSFEVQIPSANSSGLAKGLGGSGALLDLIPKDAQIKTGDLVVSGDFLIGLIGEIKKEDASPFQQAEISPFFDISGLNNVFIILDF